MGSKWGVDGSCWRGVRQWKAVLVKVEGREVVWKSERKKAGGGVVVV